MGVRIFQICPIYSKCKLFLLTWSVILFFFSFSPWGNNITKYLCGKPYFVGNPTEKSSSERIMGAKPFSYSYWWSSQNSQIFFCNNSTKWCNFHCCLWASVFFVKVWHNLLAVNCDLNFFFLRQLNHSWILDFIAKLSYEEESFQSAWFQSKPSVVGGITHTGFDLHLSCVDTYNISMLSS